MNTFITFALTYIACVVTFIYFRLTAIKNKLNNISKGNSAGNRKTL